MPTTLEQYGFATFPGQRPMGDGEYPARVITASTTLCRVVAQEGELLLPYGKELGIPGYDDGLCAGDWIVVDARSEAPYARALLPRATALRRMSTKIGVSHDQIIAANVDFVLIVTSANQEFRLSRLERYLVAVWDSGAQPIVVLTKCDLHSNPEKLAVEAEKIAPGAQVYAVSGITGEGIEPLRARLRGKSAAAVGMSGVGKSTLVNALAGSEIMRTQDARAVDDRGRHTTTHREMVLVGDIVLIDTPGMRSFGLWEAENIEQAFPEILALAEGCRFRDCKHEKEPHCAVKAAVESGELDARRLKSYLKIAAGRKARKPKRA